jgi:hypothetical protein
MLLKILPNIVFIYLSKNVLIQTQKPVLVICAVFVFQTLKNLVLLNQR